MIKPCISQNIMAMTLPADLEINAFVDEGEKGCFHTELSCILSGSKKCIHVSPHVTTRFRKVSPSSLYCLQHSLHILILTPICSGSSKRGTYLAETRRIPSLLVGCLVDFRFNGPLRQYISLYRTVSQREGERGDKRTDESKNIQTTPTCNYYKRSRPLPYCNPNCRTPQHWKFTQHHRTTRPPPEGDRGNKR